MVLKVSFGWVNEIRKAVEIICMYDLVNRLKERSSVIPLPLPGSQFSQLTTCLLCRMLQTNNAAIAVKIAEKLKQKGPNLQVSVRMVQRTLKKTF